MPKKHGFYLLTVEDREAVEKLRFENLAEADGFTARADALLWSEGDAKGSLYGVYDQGELIASMRLDLVESKEELWPKIDFEGMEEFISFPSVLLGKAATAKKARGQGLNSYLLYLAYQEARAKGVRFVMGTMMPNTPRLQVLKDIGHEFVENPEGWRRFSYKSDGATLVTYLDVQKNAARIEKILQPRVAELQEKYGGENRVAS